MGNSTTTIHSTLLRHITVGLATAAVVMLLVVQPGCSGSNPFARHRPRCPHRSNVYGDCGCASTATQWQPADAESTPVESTPVEAAPADGEPFEMPEIDTATSNDRIPGYDAGWRDGQAFAMRYGLTSPVGAQDELPAMLSESRNGAEWRKGFRAGINEYVRSLSTTTEPGYRTPAALTTNSGATAQVRSRPAARSIEWPETPPEANTPPAILSNDSLNVPLSDSITLSSPSGRTPEAEPDITSPDTLIDENAIDQEAITMNNQRTLQPESAEQSAATASPQEIVADEPAIDQPASAAGLSDDQLAERVERMFAESKSNSSQEPLVEWEQIGSFDPLVSAPVAEQITETPRTDETATEDPADAVSTTPPAEMQAEVVTHPEIDETQPAEGQPESPIRDEVVAEIEQPADKAVVQNDEINESRSQIEDPQREATSGVTAPAESHGRSVLTDLVPVTSDFAGSPMRHVPANNAIPIETQEDGIILSATVLPQEGNLSPSERLLFPSAHQPPMLNGQYRQPAAQPTPATPVTSPAQVPVQKAISPGTQIPIFRGASSTNDQPLRQSISVDQLDQQQIELHPLTNLTARPYTQLQSKIPARNAASQNSASRAHILHHESEMLYIPPSAVEVLPAVGPQLDELLKGEDRSLPISNSPALSPRQANPSLDELFR